MRARPERERFSKTKVFTKNRDATQTKKRYNGNEWERAKVTYTNHNEIADKHAIQMGERGRVRDSSSI